MNFLYEHKKQVAILLIVVAAALGVIGLIVLPERLIMQLSIGGQATNTMSKPLGLLMPFALTVVPAVIFAAAKKPGEQSKCLVVSVVGVVAFIFTFAVNLMAM